MAPTWSKLVWVADRLGDEAERQAVADTLEMEPSSASLAVAALRREIARRLSLKSESRS